MNKNVMTNEEIEEIFNKLNISNDFSKRQNLNKKFEVWEIPPIKKKIRSFTMP